MPLLTSSSFSVDVRSLGALNRIARKIAHACVGGEVIFLTGELGAGKTTFVQNMAKALFVSTIVNSPTFLVMKEYSARDFEIIHADCYRIESFADLFSIGVTEKIGQFNNVCVIEWPERVAELEGYPHIHLFFNISDKSRLLTIKKHGSSKLYDNFWSKITL